MGRGRSGAARTGGGGGGGSAAVTRQDFPEALAPGKDYQAVGGVDHNARTVSRTTQREWDQFTSAYQTGVTAADEAAIMRNWTPQNGLTGYVRTQNAFNINATLYDPANDGKTVDQMFSRSADRKTVKTLDKLIDNHQTQADASYTRFCSPAAVQASFGLTNQQMALLMQAPKMNQAQIDQLNKSLRGTKSYSAAFTSASANRSLNAFSDPNAPQSRGYIFERKLNVPKGTKAFAPRGNAQESETIFGRRLQTKDPWISVASDGHILIHETYDGYRP